VFALEAPAGRPTSSTSQAASYLSIMPIERAALAAQTCLFDEDARSRDGVVVVDLGDVAQRRKRLAAYAGATQPVIVYRFVFPPAASRHRARAWRWRAARCP
jgi:hypothetical protein